MTRELEGAKRAAGCDDSCCGGLPGEAVLRELGRFSRSWDLGPVLAPLNGARLTRGAVDRRIVARAAADPGFREVLLGHPRWVYMVALEEAFGLSKLAFLGQVREVRLLEERPDLVYLVLPIAADLEARFLGRETAAEDAAASADGERSVREEIEGRLLAGAAEGSAGRRALLFQPQDTYLDAARSIAGGELPPYLRSVREVRVVPETPTSLALVLPVAPGAG